MNHGEGASGIIQISIFQYVPVYDVPVPVMTLFEHPDEEKISMPIKKTKLNFLNSYDGFIKRLLH